MEIKNRQQILLIVAITAVAVFGGDKLILTPMTNAWQARATRIKELRARIAEDKMLVQRETSIRGRWAYMRGNTLTNNQSAAAQNFFRALYDWQQNSGVSMSATTPQWKQDSDAYMTYQCRVDAAGNLSSLSRFLYEIERNPLAIKLDSIELSAHDKEGQQLTMALQLSGLVLTSPNR